MFSFLPCHDVCENILERVHKSVDEFLPLSAFLDVLKVRILHTVRYEGYRTMPCTFIKKVAYRIVPNTANLTFALKVH